MLIRMQNKNWQLPVDKYIKKGYWRPYSFGEELRIWAEKYGDRTALVARGQRISYQELDQIVDELTAGFIGLGIRPGDRVLMQLPNTIEFVASFFALFRFGAIPIFTMPASREADIDALCAHAEPVAYITTSHFLGFDYQPMVRKMAAKHSCLKFLITDDGLMPGTLSLQTLRQPPKVEYTNPHYQDTALLLISGGTTGTPKLIPRRHTDYAFNARASAERCGINKDSVYLCVLPSAHNFSLSSPGILGVLTMGGRIVFGETTSYDEAFPLIEKEKVTITALVPALLNLWLEAREWEDADLSSLRLLQVGGAPLDPAVAAMVGPVLGCRLQQVFGTAEGLLCYTSPDDPDEVVLHTQGRPLCVDDEIRFVDEHDNDVAPGEEGELLVRGPYTIQGYYRAPEVNKRAITPDGYYRSGDIARMTPDGNIQVRGRIKDQINKSGEKIASIEIENHLRCFAGIQDAAVVGVPDTVLGERLCAWVISEDSTIDLSKIHKFFQDYGFARHKFPDQLEIIDTWPVTSVGKINKRELISLAAARQTAAFDLSG